MSTTNQKKENRRGEKGKKGVRGMITKKGEEREVTKRLMSVFHLILNLVGKRGANSQPQMESMVQKCQGTGPLEPAESTLRVPWVWDPCWLMEMALRLSW